MSGIINSAGSKSGVIGFIPTIENTISDYEVGTWTPKTNETSIANQNLIGNYIKVGNLVFLEIKCTVYSTNSASIYNLPFTTATGGSWSGWHAFNWGRASRGENIDNNGYVKRAFAGGTLLYFRNNGGSSTGEDAADNLTTHASGSIEVSISGWIPID